MSTVAALGLSIFVGADQSESSRPLVLAHYMPWYEAKPRSPHWGWHWTMGAFDPEKIANGRRPIAAHYYPLIGPYDSGDPAVLEYHLSLMRMAGIDGVVVDWYGRTNHLDYGLIHRNCEALFRSAERLGLKFAVCYEDQTIARLAAVGKLAAPDRSAHARQEIAWLQEHWFKSPAYVRRDGRPLLLSFGADGLTDAEWAAVLPSGPDAPLYLSEHRRRPCAVGAFDWPIPSEYPRSLDRFYVERSAWPTAMAVAFPRFHDIYAEAKARASYGRIPDDDGRTFAATLRRALESRVPFVQIATWNDWGEGTGIEPTFELGYRDLEMIQRVRRELLDRSFPFIAGDLRLPHRLLRLRRRTEQRPTTVDLDAISMSLIAGDVAAARRQLDQQEDARR